MDGPRVFAISHLAEFVLVPPPSHGFCAPPAPIVVVEGMGSKGNRNILNCVLILLLYSRYTLLCCAFGLFWFLTFGQLIASSNEVTLDSTLATIRNIPTS